MPKYTKNWCLPSSSFDMFLVDFWREIEGMLAPRSHQKSMPPLKGWFCKNWWKVFFLIFQGYGVEVGSKSQSKIDWKIKPKMDCLLALIVGGCWWVSGGKLGWKIEPRARKYQSKNASKTCWKKDAFWRSLGGVRPCARHGEGWILGPPNYQF